MLTADIHLEPLWKIEIPLIVSLANEAFSDYFVPIQFNETSFLAFLVTTGVSWDASHVIFEQDKPIGFLLLARRGWSVRIAMMGISPAYRKRGCGSQTLAIVIDEARARGDHLLELEVISTNAPALQLYKKFGFEILQDLYGFRHPAGEGRSNNELEEVDIRTVAHKVAAAGAPDLPWQLSAETLACYSPPMKAYHRDGAYAVISDPMQPTITLMSLIVEPNQRGVGRAHTMLGALVSEFGQKEITVPALCPASFESLFTSVGFERTKLSQHHMRLDIEGNNI